MPIAYGIGGIINVPQGPLTGYGPPGASFKGQLGQEYFDITQTPSELYVYNGQSWVVGGVNPASYTNYGTVELSPYSTWTTGGAAAAPAAITANANDIYTYVATYASAGGAPASATVDGIVYLAANTDVVSPYAYTKAPNEALTPSNITPMFASPAPIGSSSANTERGKTRLNAY